MTDGALTPQPGILEITPYQAGATTLRPAGGGASSAEGANRILKLSSNENPLGPSPNAIAAVQKAAEHLALYPASDHHALREAIGAVHGLDPAAIVCGAGSDELIALLCQAYAGPGDTVLHTEHGFSMYRISALAAGAQPVAVAERARRADVDALIAAADETTRLVFLANPNNPTGTMISPEAVARLAEGLPATCLLVLDGAYAEYVETPGFDAGAALIAAGAQVVMTRTFSKIYGLGGLRIGWAHGPASVIDVLNRVRGPFNVSAAGLAAAEAAVRDTAYTAACRAENRQWRDWLLAEITALGLAVDPSEANFLLVRFPSEAAAGAADARLQSDGIIARRVAGYGFPEGLRITIGDEIACRRVAAALSAWAAGQAA